MPYFRLFKRALCLLVLLSVVLTAASCHRAPSARQILGGLLRELSLRGAPYSSLAGEGEEGYARPGLFEELYPATEEHVLEYAVYLGSGLFAVRECAVLVCYTEYDAKIALASLEKRLELLAGIAASAELEMPEGAFARRCGRVAVLFALEGAMEAEGYFKSVL